MKSMFIILISLIISFSAYADELSINIGNKIFESDNLKTAEDICRYYKYEKTDDHEWTSKDGSTITVVKSDSTIYGRITEVCLNSNKVKIDKRLKELGFTPIKKVSFSNEFDNSAVYHNSGRYCQIFQKNGICQLIFFRRKD